MEGGQVVQALPAQMVHTSFCLSPNFGKGGGARTIQASSKKHHKNQKEKANEQYFCRNKKKTTKKAAKITFALSSLVPRTSTTSASPRQAPVVSHAIVYRCRNARSSQRSDTWLATAARSPAMCMCVFVCAHVCVHMRACLHVWREIEMSLHSTGFSLTTVHIHCLCILQKNCRFPDNFVPRRQKKHSLK